MAASLRGPSGRALGLSPRAEAFRPRPLVPVAGTTWSILGLSFAAFLVRVLSLRPNDLGGDGSFSLALAWLELPQMLAITARDTHPPLYYLLLRWWTELAGSGAFAARYLGVFLSTASVPLLYAIGKRAASPAVGLVAALFLAFSALDLMFTVTVRDFITGLFFELVALWLFLRLLGREEASGLRAKTWVLWGGYVAASLASLYTYYLYAGAFAGQGLYLLWCGARRPLFRRWLVAAVGVSVGYLPWILFAAAPLLNTFGKWRGFGHLPPDYVPADPFHGFLSITFRHLLSADGLPLPPWSYTFAFGVLILWAWAERRRGLFRAPALVPLSLFVIGFGASVIYAWGTSSSWLNGHMGRRYLFAAFPFFLVLLAYLVVIIGQRRWWVGGVLSGTLVLLSLYSHIVYLQTPADYDDPQALAQMRRLAQEEIQGHDRVVFTSAGHAGHYQMWYGRNRSWSLVTADPFKGYLTDDVAHAAQGLADSPSLGGRALWLFLYGGPLAENEPLRRSLANQLYPVGHYWLPYMLVNVYALPQGPLVPQEVKATFEGGIELVEAALTPVASVGGAVNLALRWQAKQPLAEDYKVFVHLIGDGGRLRAQHDEQPVNRELPTTRWEPGQVIGDNHGLLLPPDIPPGSYQIVVGLYTPQRRLELVGGGNALPVGKVQLRAPEGDQGSSPKLPGAR